MAKKINFLLTTLKVVYVLSTPMPEVVEDEPLEATRRRSKWENYDYICRGHILNGMSDSLFDVYQNVESAKELWDSLESKYMAEDASSKKFLVSNFMGYKMIDSRPVMEQYHEMLRILGQFSQHNLKMDEAISVAVIIDKLPPSWKDFKHTLKHKKEDLTLVQLASHLRIEESLKTQELDNNPKGNNQIGKDDKSSNKKAKLVCWGCNKPGHLKKDCRLCKVNKDKDVGPSGSKDPDKQQGQKSDFIQNLKYVQNYVSVISEAFYVQDDDVAWWVDSGATSHVCKDLRWFKDYQPIEDGPVVKMGNVATEPIKGLGSVLHNFTSGKLLSLDNVLYVPGIRKNLLSETVLRILGEHYALNGHRKLKKNVSVLAASQTLAWNSGLIFKEKASQKCQEAHQLPRWRLGRWPRTPGVFGTSRRGTLLVVFLAYYQFGTILPIAICIMDERKTMGDYLAMDQGYYDFYSPMPQQDPYDDDWWGSSNSDENQHDGYFLVNQERSHESSLDKKLDLMMELLKEGFKQKENNSKAISILENQLEQMVEQLQQQPSDDHSDTMQADEVTNLCSDESFDINVHKPTPPDYEVVVEDYVSINEEDIELETINQEKSEFELETSQIIFQELETPKVGEGSVESNTTPNLTNFKQPKKQILVDIFEIDCKRLDILKKPNAIINRPILTTIYAQISCQEGVIDVTFGNQKFELQLFRCTNDPPVGGDLFVINTMDDYFYEHTANMLADTTDDLEKLFSCNRLKDMDKIRSQNVKKRMWKKKHYTIRSYKSKMKVVGGIKSRLKNFTPRRNACQFKTRFKCSFRRLKGKRPGFDKVKVDMPFDPGETQELTKKDWPYHITGKTAGGGWQWTQAYAILECLLLFDCLLFYGLDLNSDFVESFSGRERDKLGRNFGRKLRIKRTPKAEEKRQHPSSVPDAGLELWANFQGKRKPKMPGSPVNVLGGVWDASLGRQAFLGRLVMERCSS
ncbi:hypothetical protein L2E82_51458 [Cichorium intybus]|nr:hypothetical protein L2E82_51458 [Cichorium intybus]